MAVGSGRYKHPPGLSNRLSDLIDALLVVDPEQRPDIENVRGPSQIMFGADKLQVLHLTEAAMKAG